MSPATILERIRHLFASERSAHLDCISDAFEKDTPKEPAQPMSDQELARAIREFRSAPVSDWSLARLSRPSVEASAPRDG